MKNLTTLNNLILLSNFGFLTITGRDAKKFLQGYTTCDLNDLGDGRSSFGAICNIQGRMVVNFRVVQTKSGLLLRLSKDLINEVTHFLKKYIVFSKAEINDASDIMACYGCLQADESLKQLTTVFDTVFESDTKDSNATELNTHDKQHTWKLLVEETPRRYEIWTNIKHNKDQLSDLQANLTNWRKSEIKAGFAWVDATSQGQYLPQMFNLQHLQGINFDKGCYLGQEIVARMQFRGKLKKTLHIGTATRKVDNGETLFSDEGRAIGTVVAAEGVDFLAIAQAKSIQNGNVSFDNDVAINIKSLNPDA